MRALALALLLLLPSLARAGGGAAPPGWLPLPPQVQPRGEPAYEDWSEYPFEVKGTTEPALVRGHYWHTDLAFEGLGGEAAGKEVWAKIKPALVKGGWTVANELDENPFTAVFRYQKGGHDAWGRLQIPGPGDFRLDLIDVAPQPLKFSVKPPADTPEKLSPDRGDLPYLPPLPGSTPGAFAFDPQQTFTVPVQGQEEEQLVGTGTYNRDYRREKTSNVQFQALYREALKAAGWAIVVDSQGISQSDTVLTAHYAKGQRDVWAMLHHSGDEYTVRVADVGKDNLAAQLARECHVALYGVFFDFDKATLKRESDSALGRASEALKGNPKLAIEVQGHTDNLGADDYNARLSDARARAVMQWLVASGIPAGQLTAKGYGKGKPVASNDSPEGRARNRRVELTCRK